ncbi:MAG TPA: hypothetical protein VE222_07815, partial [Nitrospiraceae bacterium]|nr:hypothetical protein [Nitrospiraceae bacterium]
MHALTTTVRPIAIGLLSGLSIAAEPSILCRHLAVAAESPPITLRRANELFSQSEFTRAVQEYEAFISTTGAGSDVAAEVPEAYY